MSLKAHQIEIMVTDLYTLDVWFRDLDKLGTSNHLITDPARVKVRGLISTLLRASLSDVEVETTA